MILTFSTLGFHGYWGYKMSVFAEGVKQDAKQLNK